MPLLTACAPLMPNAGKRRRLVCVAALALSALPRVAMAAPAPANTGTAVAPPMETSDKTWSPRKESDPITNVVYDIVSRPNFSLEYPDTWKPDTGAKDFDANTNFTLVSPKNSYVQFTILPRTSDPAKIVSDTVKQLDGPAITTLAKTKIDAWGSHKGQGYHLKGKIVGSFPGGIKVFVFSSTRFNILIIEYYFSDELKDVQDDLDYISDNFKMSE
jgi:hypothetical protein